MRTTAQIFGGEPDENGNKVKPLHAYTIVPLQLFFAPTQYYPWIPPLFRHSLLLYDHNKNGFGYGKSAARIYHC